MRHEARPSTVPSPAGESTGRPLWEHADFLKLWTAQTISVFGDHFSELAIPLIAVLTLGATPGQMGILTAVTRAVSPHRAVRWSVGRQAPAAAGPHNGRSRSRGRAALDSAGSYPRHFEHVAPLRRR